MIEVLFGLLFFASIVMLVGHGMWVVVAWVFRRGRPKQEQTSFEPTLTDDRSAMTRHVNRLLDRKIIDKDLRDRMIQAIADDMSANNIDKNETATFKPQTDKVIRGVAASPPKKTLPLPSNKPEQNKGQALQPSPMVVQAKPQLASPTSPTTAPVKPARPSRSLGEVLATFMADKNIRWGELIGGLLIVCCSGALVISLWSQIQAIPLLKFMIFTTVNVALFGTGLFVHHRWKVPTTGRAILSIATLLVPLNLLAFAAFSFNQQSLSPWTVVIQAISVILFAFLTILSSRVIMPTASKLLAGGFMAISAISLLMQFFPARNTTTLWVTCSLPVGLYVILTSLAAWRMVRIFKSSAMDKEQAFSENILATRLFFMLSMFSFACMAPLGLAIYLANQYCDALQYVAPLVSLLAVPGLMISYILWHRQSELTPFTRITAACITLVGLVVMLLGVGLAWPLPGVLLPTLLVNALAMLVLGPLGRRFGITIRWVNYVTMGWLTLAWALFVHLAKGQLSWDTTDAQQLVDSLLSILTAKALIVPVLLSVGRAQWCAFGKQAIDSLGIRKIQEVRGYWMTAAIIAIPSVMLLTFQGFGHAGDTDRIIWVYVLYAAMAILATWQVRHPLPTWCSIGLMQMALVQYMVYVQPLPEFTLASSLLVGASLCVVGILVVNLLITHKRRRELYLQPWAYCGVGLSAIAGGWMALHLSPQLLGDFGLRLFWITGLWMLLSLTLREFSLFAISQLTFLVATWCMVHQHLLTTQPDCWAYETLWQAPQYWQIQGLVLGSMSLLWLLIRLLLSKIQRPNHSTDTTRPSRLKALTGRLHEVINPPRPMVDHTLAWVTLIGSLVLGAWSIGIQFLLELGAWQRNAADTVYAITSSNDAAGRGSWFLLGLAVVIFVIRFFKRNRAAASAALILCWFTAIALIAARFTQDHHVINAWRWLLSGTCVLGIGSLIVLPRKLAISEKTIGQMQYWIYGLFALPALASTMACALALVQYPHGIGTLFTSSLQPASIPDAAIQLLMLGPVALIVGTLVAMGLHRVQKYYASAAAALTSVFLVVIEICIFSYCDFAFSMKLLFILIQINAIVSALLALTWDQLARFLHKPLDQVQHPVWPLLIGRVTLCAGLGLAALAVFVSPDDGPQWMQQAGSFWGISAYLLIEFAILRITANRSQLTMPISQWSITSVILLSLAFAPFDTGQWLSFHILAVGWGVAGWMLLLTLGRYTHKLAELDWEETFTTVMKLQGKKNVVIEHDLTCTQCQYNLRGLKSSGECSECGGPISNTIENALSKLDIPWITKLNRVKTHVLWSMITCISLGILFAIRGAWDDPQLPWWSLGILLGITIQSMALGAWAPQRGFAYLGGLAACIGATIGYEQLSVNLVNLAELQHIINLIHFNLCALVVSGFAWLWIERTFLRKRLSETSKHFLPVFHHMAAGVATLILTITAGVVLACYLSSQYATNVATIHHVALSSWIALGLTMLLVITCVKEKFCKQIPAMLYMLGLSTVAHVLTVIPPQPQSIPIILCLAVSGYVLITSLILYVTSKRNTLQSLLANNSFIPCANILLSVLLLCGALGISIFHPILTMRAAAGAIPLICAMAMILLRWQGLRHYIFMLLCICPLLIRWIWISPTDSFAWPGRTMGYIDSFAWVTLAISVFVSRLHQINASTSHNNADRWLRVVKNCYAVIGTLGCIAIIYTSGNELHALLTNRTLPFNQPMAYSLLASYVLLILACVVFAIKDQFDPLALAERSKKLYIYAAQILGGLLTLHLRATMPWLFTGFATAYWPLVVLGIAVTGIASGEWCSRRNLPVIGKPLTNTGTWLPLVACLELFIRISSIHYSLVLLAVGAIYLVLAIMKRSFTMGILATLALNGSLWYLLHHTPGLGITEHPQLWIIPLAIAVLTAGYLNSNQLTADQNRSLHYGCLLAIYLSSTLDVFLIGVARAPWLPLALAGLSIIGIFIGLARHIRSYLFLGTGFLCLSLLTIIWHAATNLGWTWVWYVAGIALGVGIITIFALFEKKKNEMATIIDEVKDWSS